jgi:hypothetical protein
MPGRRVPKKDEVHCEKLRGAVCKRKTRRCPNGETRQGSNPVIRKEGNRVN